MVLLLSSTITIPAASRSENTCLAEPWKVEQILELPLELQHKIATYVLGDKIKRDIFDSKLIRTLAFNNETLSNVCFNPQGTALSFATYPNNTINFWDIDSGRLNNTWHEHVGAVRSVAFNPEGTFIISASNDGTIGVANTNDHDVRHWHIDSKTFRNKLYAHNKAISSAAINSKGTLIASGSSDHTIKLWHFDSSLFYKKLDGHEGFVTSVAFNPEGTLIASASTDNTIKVWDTDSGKLHNTLHGHEGPVMSVTFNPQGTLIASASFDDTIKVWDTDSGQLCNTLHGHEGSVKSVAFSPDGSLIASASNDNTIKVWDADSGQLCDTLHGHKDNVRSVTFNPKRSLIASCSNDHTVKLWGCPLKYEEHIWNMNFNQVIWIYHQYQMIMQDNTPKRNNRISKEEKRAQIISKLEIERSIDPKIVSRIQTLKAIKQAGQL
jgi:WD40 repeat protein